MIIFLLPPAEYIKNRNTNNKFIENVKCTHPEAKISFDKLYTHSIYFISNAWKIKYSMQQHKVTRKDKNRINAIIKNFFLHLLCDAFGISTHLDRVCYLENISAFMIRYIVISMLKFSVDYDRYFGCAYVLNIHFICRKKIRNSLCLSRKLFKN